LDQHGPNTQDSAESGRHRDCCCCAPSAPRLRVRQLGRAGDSKRRGREPRAARNPLHEGAPDGSRATRSDSRTAVDRRLATDPAEGLVPAERVPVPQRPPHYEWNIDTARPFHSSRLLRFTPPTRYLRLLPVVLVQNEERPGRITRPSRAGSDPRVCRTSCGTAMRTSTRSAQAGSKAPSSLAAGPRQVGRDSRRPPQGLRLSRRAPEQRSLAECPHERPGSAAPVCRPRLRCGGGSRHARSLAVRRPPARPLRRRGAPDARPVATDLNRKRPAIPPTC